MSNPKFRSYAVAGVSAAALVLSAGLAHAQAANAVEEVVVTATKREVNVQDVPSAISVLGGAKVQQYQLSTFTDLARLDPALQYSSNGVGDSRIIVRGIQSGGAATVAVYLDEAVITGQTFESATGGAQADIGLHDIERVEILKGPQGTLFGASSMAGTVRIITKKPSLDDYHGSVSVTASAGSGTNNLWETEAVANVPIIKDTLGLRVVGWHTSGGGYIDDVSSGATNVNDQDVTGVRGTALFKPTDRFTLTLGGTYQKISVDGTQRYDLQLGPYLNDSPTLEPYDERLHLFTGVAEYKLDFGTITAASSWFDRKQVFSLDTTPTAAGFGLPGDYTDLEWAKRTTWSNELRFASDFKGPFQIVFGGAYQEDINDYENIVGQVPKDTILNCTSFAECRANGLGNAIVSARHVHSPFFSHAFFGEAEYKLTDKLTFTAGVRHFNSSQHNTEVTLQSLRFPAPPPAPIQAAGTLAVNLYTKQKKTSYNFAVTYKANDDLTVYARAASGFRQGGINNAAFAANFGTQIPAGFGPDQIWNYEVGAKGRTLNNMLSFDMAAYHIDWSDQQVPAVSANGAFTFTTNAGKSVVNGVEMQGTLRPLEGLTLTLGGTYTDSHLTQDQPPTSGDENAPGKKGDRLPYVSRWAFTGSGEYDWPISNLQGYVRANVNYRSRAYTFFNTDNPFYTKVADYIIGDISAGIKTGNWEIGLLVRNVTNEHPKLSIDPGPDGFRVTSVRPRNFGITARASF